MAEMNREQAAARLAALQKDAGWSQRYLAGGAAERTEMRTLNRILAGVRAPRLSPQEDAQARQAELMTDPEWRQRCMEGDPQARAELAALNATIAADGEDEE